MRNKGVLLLGLAAFLAHGGPIISRLGFYHDDWPLLWKLAQHDGGLPSALLMQWDSTHLYRPFSVLAWTLPYWLFGLNPLPWHLLMATLTAVSGGLLFSVLGRLGAPKGAALAGALLYIAFPNKDATLFWPCVSLIQTCSVIALLLSYREHLRYVENGATKRLLLSGALFFVALSFYEQGFFLAPLWALAPGQNAARRKRGLAAAVAAMLLVAALKFAILPRFIPYNKPMQYSLGHAVMVYEWALRCLFDLDWLAYLGRIAWQGLRWNPLLALGAAALPWFAGVEAKGSRKAGIVLLSWGLTLWFLAYLPLCVSDYVPTPYSHMNRLNQLPAIGVAAALCGAALLLSRPAVVSALASLALMISPAFAEIWAEAQRRQLAVKAALESQWGAWPKDKRLLLRVPEPYVARKAPLFLADGDINGAVGLWFGEAREAMVYNPSTRPTRQGLMTRHGLIPYSQLVLLDMADGRLAPLARERARVLPPWTHPMESPLRLW